MCTFFNGVSGNWHCRVRYLAQASGNWQDGLMWLSINIFILAHPTNTVQCHMEGCIWSMCWLCLIGKISVVFKIFTKILKCLVIGRPTLLVVNIQQGVCHVSQKKTDPDKLHALLQILFWRRLLYLNNSNATTFSQHLPKTWVYLMR